MTGAVRIQMKSILDLKKGHREENSLLVEQTVKVMSLQLFFNYLFFTIWCNCVYKEYIIEIFYTKYILYQGLL